MLGLTAVSGGLLVACAGAPKVTLPTTPTTFGLGPLPFELPALQAPAAGPVPIDQPLVNQQVPASATIPLKLDATTSTQTNAVTQSGAFAAGGCELGH